MNGDDDNWKLILQKAYDIIDGNYNKSHDSLIIQHYIRVNIEEISDLVIPNSIKQTCQLFWGTMSTNTFDKLCAKLQSIQELMWDYKKNIDNLRFEAMNVKNQIDKEMKLIKEKTETVESELFEAKPELETAQKAVSKISKKQLREIKCLRNPPKLAEMTLNAVCILLDYSGSKRTADQNTRKSIIQSNQKKIDLLMYGFIRLCVVETIFILKIPAELIETIKNWIDFMSFGETYEISSNVVSVTGNTMNEELMEESPEESDEESIDWTKQSILARSDGGFRYWLPRIPEIKYSYSWSCIQQWLEENDFIPSILKFDTNKIREKTRQKIIKEYMSNEYFIFDKVNKTSKVAGPLVLWVAAQITFSHLLHIVEPMTKEIMELKAKSTAKQKSAEEIQKRIADFTMKYVENGKQFDKLNQLITDLQKY